MPEDISGSAYFSVCGLYRWVLYRSWEYGNGEDVCFIMLNPSIANATKDDPTIRRCIGFARRWGFSSLCVRNLFALIATSPTKLRLASDPTGGDIGDKSLSCATGSHTIVAAWGAKVPFGRDRFALDLFRGRKLYCLGTTKNGSPRHPLYVRYDQPLEIFNTKPLDNGNENA